MVISPERVIVDLDIVARSGVVLGNFGSTEPLGLSSGRRLAEVGARPGRRGEGAEMNVVGQTSIASRRAVIRTPENLLDLRRKATSPSPQQPKPPDHVYLATRHQKTPEPGFPYRYAPTYFDRSFTTHHLADGHLSTVPACASPHADKPNTAQVGDIRPVPVCVQRTGRRDLPGHTDGATTMIYTHVLNRGSAAVRSPADRMLTPAAPAAEIDCKVLQPISAPSDTRAPALTHSNQGITARIEIRGQGNRLQRPAALKVIQVCIFVLRPRTTAW